MISRETAPQVAVALEHGADPGQVGLEPVLLLVARASSRDRLAIIWLMLSFSSPTSPAASTVMVRVRSPWVTAVATSAMDRTWVVRFPASWFTFSVRRAHVPGDALHLGLTAELALGAHLAGHTGDLGGEGRELVHHLVDGVLQLEDLAPGVHRDVLGQVALGHGGGDLGDVPHLVGQVVGHGVDVVGQVLPHAGHARHGGLTAELALGADLAGHPGHLGGEGGELVHHRVDGVLQLEQLAPQLHGDLAGQVASGHGGGDLGDVPDLAGQVGGQLVDVVGQVLPGAGHAGHDGLAAEAAFGADLAGHPGDLVGEGPELVDHRVDGVLQLGHLAAGLHRDLLGQVALGHGGGDLGDVPDLAGQVAGQLVDVVGQVLPGAGDAGHLGLAAEAAFGADLAGDPGDLVGEGARAGRPSC